MAKEGRRRKAGWRERKEGGSPLLDLLALATLSTVWVKQSAAEPTGEKDTLRDFSLLCTMSSSDCSRHNMM